MTQASSNSNVFERAGEALRCSDAGQKCRMAWQLAADSACERLSFEMPAAQALPIPEPGRPAGLQLVHPRQLEQRKLASDEGRAVFLHALAHIEFNAINLALDAVYRFRQMPRGYLDDWLRVASEEATHFQWIVRRLQHFGHQYGDFPAHNGLWDMAVRTDDDVLKRMALVPRVFEARGLDVTPGMIQRLRHVGDTESAVILEQIYAEELDHVAAGDRWFRWACLQQQREPESTYLALVKAYLPGQLRARLNREARRKVGFSEAEMDRFEAEGVRR